MKKVSWMSGIEFLPVYVGCTDNEAAYAREVRRLTRKSHPSPCVTPGATATAHRYYNGRGELVVLVGFNRNRISKGPAAFRAGIFAHEAVHAADWIFEEIGEDKPSDEFRAHLTQRITWWFFQEYHAK